MKTEQSEKTGPSLSRAKESNVAGRMIFQRDYKVGEPCAEKTPAGFADQPASSYPVLHFSPALRKASTTLSISDWSL